MTALSTGATAPMLDRRETHFHMASPLPGLSLFLRYLPPERATRKERVVLYVHGGTFPSALALAHRFDGRSWRDELCAAGFHAWGLDFHGFGIFSDPYPEMDEPADRHGPLGRTENASRQLEHAVRFICRHHGIARLSIIAHSWGTMVAGHLAGRCPDLIDRLVFFGPIARRTHRDEPQHLPAWRLISLKDQWARFTADVPADEPAVLSCRHFAEWGEAYLDVDPASRSRTPPGVKTPSGSFQDIFDAWAGDFPYDPALIRAPVAIIRGEWDGMCRDDDALWLFRALTSSPLRRDIKIGRGTHLLHLETGRYALYREAEAFLVGHDRAPER